MNSLHNIDLDSMAKTTEIGKDAIEFYLSIDPDKVNETYFIEDRYKTLPPELNREMKKYVEEIALTNSIHSLVALFYKATLLTKIRVRILQKIATNFLITC